MSEGLRPTLLKNGRPGAIERRVEAYVNEKAVGLEQVSEGLRPTLLKRW